MIWVTCVFIVILSVGVRLRLLAVFKELGWLKAAAELPPEKPRVSVIVPARNEARDLEQMLRRVLAQEGVELEVIVVNDHSSDATGRIADSIAKSDPRVRVMHDPALPAGWLGKANAMQQAARLAKHDLLLFSDADIMHHQRCFVSGIAESQRENLDFLSLLPEFRPITFWENMLVPAFTGALVQFITPRIYDPKSPDALAAGAFLLVKRDAFEAVGGFETIKGEMADDVALARILKQKGYRIGLKFAPELLSVSLFKTNREAFWSATKNILIATERIKWLNGPFSILVALLFLMPFVVFWTPLVVMAMALMKGDAVSLMVGLMTYLSQLMMILPVRRVYRFHPLTILGFPLVAFPIVCCGFRALYYRWVHGAVVWRGRAIKVAETP